MRIAFHRLGPALALALLAGCADDRADKPLRVTAAPTTTVTTTSVAPPITKPLTTAPPSPLLDEVVAAYDAAYADLLAAEAVMDEHFPALDDHIAGGQLETWRRLIRKYRSEGLSARANEFPAWRRVEGLQIPDPNLVVLNVCRFDNIDGVDVNGDVVKRARRSFRYLETIEFLDGGWKWTARELPEGSVDQSDCASPAS